MFTKSGQNQQTDATTQTRSAVQVPDIKPGEFSEWLDQSLSELVDSFDDFVTKNSRRRFFSR